MYSEEITGIVVDIGSKSIRAGYSGDDTPRYVVPSKCMTLLDKNDDMEIEGQQQKHSDILFGDEYLNVKKDRAAIKDIISAGVVQDYELLEQCLQHILSRQLKLTPDQFPLLLTETLHCGQHQRQKVTELVFEQLSATNYFTCKAPVLSSFSCGRANSLVIDSGHITSQAVPVLDGYALQKSASIYPVAGQWVTKKVIAQIEKTYNKTIHPRMCYQSKTDKEGNRIIEYIGLQKCDKSFYDYQKQELGQQIKEQLVFIDEEELMQKGERNSMQLPDGTSIQLGEYRNTVVEGLFDSIGRKKALNNNVNNNINNNILANDIHVEGLNDFKGLHHMVIDTINEADIDARKDFLNNVLLVGGNTLIPGFDEFFTRKLLDIAPPNAKVKLITHPTSLERLFAPWIGGSILSSLGSFQNMWIGKQEYEEHGSYIINKKCP